MKSIPLVDSYLRSLDRALAGREDHDEVLESVREHIGEALASGAEEIPDGDLVRRVLDELGPVERIASTQGTGAATVGSTGRFWPEAVASVVALASLLLVFITPFIAVPLALATLIWAIFGLRRTRRRNRSSALLVVTAVLSGLALTVALFGALFLLPGGSSVIVDSPVPVAPSSMSFNLK